MKNLKKVLALVMTFAMAFTMFTGAAFTDQADIKQTEAVDTLVALGVIAGNPDGSFKPDGNVTRAEMAKMIYVLRTGKDDAQAYASATSTFKDINGHWAAGYIKYCQALGIIAGKSATQFDPEGAVTGNEAAKMLLVTLGYDATKAGLVGHTWDKTTIALADENGLLEDVTAPMSMALPRQYAAQLMFNAVDAATVKMTDGAYSNMNIIGTYYPTIGAKYMGLSKTTGILVAAGKTGINGQAAGKEDSISVNALVSASPAETIYDYAPDITFTKVTKDYSKMLGQEVKVLYKDGDKSKVYGVYALNNNNVLAGNTSKAEKKSESKIKFDGTEYDVASGNTVATPTNAAASPIVTINGAKQTGVKIANVIDTYKNTAATFSLVDNNDDDKYEVLTVVAPTVAKVTYVGSSSITAGRSYKLADENIVEGLKKDDFAVIVDKAATRDGKVNITKADAVEGKITAIKGTDVQVDGTWYKTITPQPGDAYSLNDNFKLAVVNGYVYNAEQSGGTTVSNDKVMLAVNVDAVSTGGIDSGKQKVKAMFADGKTEIITVEKLGSKDVDAANAVLKSTMYTFEKKSNGNYNLTLLSGQTSKYDGDMQTVTAIGDNKATGTGSTTTMRFADDAAIFVIGKDDTKVLTGKAVSTWTLATASLDAAHSALYAKKSNGFLYANVGVIALAGTVNIPSSGDKLYGFVTGDSALVKDGDNYYVSMSIWNGADASLKAKSVRDSGGATTDVSSSTGANVAPFKKGTPIAYKLSSEGIISDVEDISATATAITAFDGKKYLTVNTISDELKITGDTIQLFVDTDAKTGVAGGSITEATKIENGYIKNAYVVKKSGNSDVEAIIMDTTNCLAVNKAGDTVTLVAAGTSATNAAIDDAARTLKVKTGATIAVSEVVMTASTNTVSPTNAISVKVWRNGVAATANLLTGDIIRVVAENGDVVEYVVTQL